jgi:hypothetical protein
MASLLSFNEKFILKNDVPYLGLDIIIENQVSNQMMIKPSLYPFLLAQPDHQSSQRTR